MKIEKVEGKIILEQVNFNRFLERNVTKNNDTSGKITVPKKLIGKEVFIVWLEEEES